MTRKSEQRPEKVFVFVLLGEKMKTLSSPYIALQPATHSIGIELPSLENESPGIYAISSRLEIPPQRSSISAKHFGGEDMRNPQPVNILTPTRKITLTATCPCLHWFDKNDLPCLH